jgi:hypothetical protein
MHEGEVDSLVPKVTLARAVTTTRTATKRIRVPTMRDVVKYEASSLEYDVQRYIRLAKNTWTIKVIAAC